MVPSILILLPSSHKMIYHMARKLTSVAGLVLHPSTAIFLPQNRRGRDTRL